MAASHAFTPDANVRQSRRKARLRLGVPDEALEPLYSDLQAVGYVNEGGYIRVCGVYV